jgi:hypothetical protein
MLYVLTYVGARVAAVKSIHLDYSWLLNDMTALIESREFTVMGAMMHFVVFFLLLLLFKCDKPLPRIIILIVQAAAVFVITRIVYAPEAASVWGY